jgi:hypothetical protein
LRIRQAAGFVAGKTEGLRVCRTLDTTAHAPMFNFMGKGFGLPAAITGNQKEFIHARF